MGSAFDSDVFPGRPRILFIGPPGSTHTHAWIDLLADAELNVRLFALPGRLPPDDWPVKTYVAQPAGQKLDPRTRAVLWPPGRVRRSLRARWEQLKAGGEVMTAERWLAQIIRRWRPNVIHTFGLNPSGDYFLPVRERFGRQSIGTWVLQLRGGSDLALTRFDPEARPGIERALRACDQIVTDNVKNLEYLAELGAVEEKIAPLCPVPGTGGVDVERLAGKWRGAPSERRLILWPKAYECPWSKALPVLEALIECWDDIQPCEIQMLATGEEVRAWLQTLPKAIRRCCHTDRRVPREHILEMMPQARVMLAPSLVDGVPNTLYEAMASGACPIVSPLETIRTVVDNERNVLFARNLYPAEIADALRRAMSDDALVDRVAQANLELVREVANRATIRPRVIEYYENLAQGQEVGA